MDSQLAPGTTALPHPFDELLLADPCGHAGHDPVPTQDPDLQTCPACSGRFVIPGRIHGVTGDDSVLLDLICTSCGWGNTEIHDDAELVGLDESLDVAYADLMALFETVWVANRVDEIERFAAALDAGLILPEDF